MTLRPCRQDDHKYYESKFVPQGRDYWVDLERRPDGSVFRHDMLSEAHRRAAVSGTARQPGKRGCRGEEGYGWVLFYDVIWWWSYDWSCAFSE